jgi:hypothetical protein
MSQWRRGQGTDHQGLFVGDSFRTKLARLDRVYEADKLAGLPMDFLLKLKKCCDQCKLPAIVK